MLPSIRKVGTFDIKFNPQSSISKPKRKLDFSSENLKENEENSIKYIKDNMSEYSKTSITAKVFNIGDKENQLLRNNTQMEKALAVVADGSGQITVTLWADAIAKVQIGKSYKFANLSVRIFS